MTASRLAAEVALVTGSTSGIGRVIALRLAAEGAPVLVTGRDGGRGRSTVAAIEAAGGSAAFHAADLAEESSARELVDAAVARFGRLTVLVNNAMAITSPGEPPDAAAADITTDAWERVVRVNLTAPMWLCRAAIPAMVAAGHGAIVNISSRAAVRGTPGLAAYAASKGGLNALTRSIAVDYASQRIRCNSISAGYILHEHRDRDLTPERRARLEGMHLTRLGEPGDVAAAVAYLASADAEFVTGTDLALDGGSTSARGLTLG